jgi:hypothetical protein
LVLSGTTAMKSEKKIKIHPLEKIVQKNEKFTFALSIDVHQTRSHEANDVSLPH